MAAELVVLENYTLPENCSSVFDPSVEVDPSLRKVVDVGWCASDLDAEPSTPVDSAQACWDACVEQFDGVVAVDYYPESGGCFCQDACDCVQESLRSELVVLADFELPDVCGASPAPTAATYYYGNDPRPDSTRCVDSATWFAENDTAKDCVWVNRDLRRCAQAASDRAQWAFEACRKSCGSCSFECDDASPDSESWHLASRPEKDCESGGFTRRDTPRRFLGRGLRRSLSAPRRRRHQSLARVPIRLPHVRLRRRRLQRRRLVAEPGEYSRRPPGLRLGLAR